MRREREFVLRDRIYDDPSLLPGFDGPLASAKEVPVRRTGAADLMVVDAQGQIAIVECKRASSDESRREVIGQVFEYAAMLWKNNYDDLSRIFNARRRSLTKPFEGLEGWDEETFSDAIARRLEDGEFRLIIAVDEMTKPLKRRLVRTVALLNAHLPDIQVEVVALPDSPVDISDDSPEPILRLEPKLKRWELIEQLDGDELQAVAEDLFDWADSRQVEVRIPQSRARAKVLVPAGQLFRVKPPGTVKVSLDDVDPEAASTTDLVHELGELGFNVGAGSPEASLELLVEDPRRARFLELMELHLAMLQRDQLEP